MDCRISARATFPRLTRRFITGALLGTALLLAIPLGTAMGKPPAPSGSCSFSSGVTTCVAVAAEVLDHTESPTLAAVACADANGDPSTQTRTRTDQVFRTDTTTTRYSGKGEKPANVLSTSMSSTYRVVQGTIVLGPCDDVTAPATTITAGPASPTTATTASLSFESDEPSSTFACSLDGSAFTACTSPHELADLSLGVHTFRVRATDVAGNTDETAAARSWTVVVAPVVTITDGPSGTTNSPVATFTFSGTQVGTYTCQLDDGAFTSCSSPRQIFGLTAGEHAFTVKLTNANGTATDTRGWTIEANLPICAAAITGFSQLPNGHLEFLGTDLNCASMVGHAYAPTHGTCNEGGSSGYSRPTGGFTSPAIVSWTDTRVVIDDPYRAGMWSVCAMVYGQFDGLLYDDEKRFDSEDFVLGPDPINVTLSGTTTNGLHLEGMVTSTDVFPSALAGATFTADFTHPPVSPGNCTTATGTWTYSGSGGTLVHFAPRTTSGALYANFCMTSTGIGRYNGMAKVIPTAGDLLTSSSQDIGFQFEYDQATGTVSGYQYGRFVFTT